MEAVYSRISYPFQCVLGNCGPGPLWVLTLDEEGSERDWGAHSTTRCLEGLHCQGLGVPSSSAFTGEAQESEKEVCLGRCPEQRISREFCTVTVAAWEGASGSSLFFPLDTSLNFWLILKSSSSTTICFVFQASDYKGSLQGDPVWTQSTGKRCKFVFSAWLPWDGKLCLLCLLIDNLEDRVK